MSRRRILYTSRTMALVLLALSLSACVSSPPKHTNNVCHIFDEKSGWYKDARKATKRWGGTIGTHMSIIYQESRFVAKAKPPRTRILWIIPGPRKSNAYGYSQAKKDTWKWYKKSSGHRGADRNDFDDAIDFVAWYNHISRKTLGLRENDAYSMYLAYHEGHGGFKRRTYKNKAWLKKVARQVDSRAKTYDRQLQKCEDRLNSSWWPF